MNLDNRLVDQLALHRGLHGLAGPLLAILREKLLHEKLNLELQKQPPSREVAQALEALDRHDALAENITPERKPW